MNDESSREQECSLENIEESCVKELVEKHEWKKVLLEALKQGHSAGMSMFIPEMQIRWRPDPNSDLYLEERSAAMGEVTSPTELVSLSDIEYSIKDRDPEMVVIRGVTIWF